MIRQALTANELCTSVSSRSMTAHFFGLSQPDSSFCGSSRNGWSSNCNVIYTHNSPEAFTSTALSSLQQNTVPSSNSLPHCCRFYSACRWVCTSGLVITHNHMCQTQNYYIMLCIAMWQTMSLSFLRNTF